MLIKCIRVFRVQIISELVTLRTKLLFIIIGIFIYTHMEPVVNFSKAVNIKIMPWGYTHLLNDFTCQPVIIIGLIFLFSNAPFRSETYDYIVARSGKVCFEVGNILYIFSMSIIYNAFLLLMSILSLGSRLNFSTVWGKIWGTLARTNAGEQFHTKFIVNDFIIGTFTPIKATLISFILELLCFLWIGFLIYLLNLLTNKAIGVIVSGIFVLLDIMIYNSWVDSAYIISPVTLAELSTFTKVNIKYGLTLPYAFTFFITGIILFIVASFIIIRRKNT